MENNINELEKRIKIKDEELNRVVSEFQSQFSNAQEKRIIDFSEKIKIFETEFDVAEESRKNLFNTKDAERAENFNAQKDELKTKATNTLQELSEIENKILNIYNLTGKATTVGSQKTYADKARVSSTWLFWIAFGLMCIALIITGYPLFEALLSFSNKTISEFNWMLPIYRLPVGLLFLIPAFYLAHESRKQKEIENKFRDIEVKMAAIDPFFLEIGDGACANMPELAEKDRVKLELAQKLLSPANTKDSGNLVIPKDVIELMKEVGKLVPHTKEQ